MSTRGCRVEEIETNLMKNRQAPVDVVTDAAVVAQDLTHLDTLSSRWMRKRQVQHDVSELVGIQSWHEF